MLSPRNLKFKSQPSYLAKIEYIYLVIGLSILYSHGAALSMTNELSISERFSPIHHVWHQDGCGPLMLSVWRDGNRIPLCKHVGPDGELCGVALLTTGACSMGKCNVCPNHKLPANQGLRMARDLLIKRYMTKHNIVAKPLLAQGLSGLKPQAQALPSLDLAPPTEDREAATALMLLASPPSPGLVSSRPSPAPPPSGWFKVWS